MRSDEQHTTWDRERRKPRSFSLEEAFLTRKNYKVIFCMTFTLAAVRTAFFVSLQLGWKLTEWEASVAALFLLIMELISGFVFVFIPVAFVVRILFTHLLNKKIDQLEQATWKPIAAACRQKST
ncbi:hypothetical protein [Bartonella tribocorum]|uniref:DUF4282 domain-containing protein n=1 Tax=Bartonella tribocorum TaxID=85701 RepID=A0A2N9Y8U8_9HYPH|nr:hypothetical protein [Bartonella tribocorum]PIT68131.1 hypothetical protein CER18_08210 [Bartonella tribocorum]